MSNEEEGGRGPIAVGRREALIGLALGATAVVSEAFVPRKRIDFLGSTKLEGLIPTTLGPWSFFTKSGLVVPPSDQLSLALYAQLITRVYVAPDRLPIMLLIAQSPAQDGVLQVHRPEICYPASGYTLSSTQLHDVRLTGGSAIPTRVFSATGGDRVEQLLYWTRLGDALPTSWARQRLAVAEANLRGEIPDGVLVRISTLAPDKSAIVELDAFARQLVESVPERVARVLVGSAIARRR